MSQQEPPDIEEAKPEPQAGRYTLREVLFALLRLFGFILLGLAGLLGVEWLLGWGFKGHEYLSDGKKAPLIESIIRALVDIAFVVYVLVAILIHVGEFLLYGWLEMKGMWDRARSGRHE